MSRRYTKGSTPFELPELPIDGHEVRWWSVEVVGHETKLVPHRAVYHERKRWDDLFESDGRPPGADFVRQWQVFRREHFTTRWDGWRGWEAYDWHLDYGTEREATLKAIEFTEQTIRRHEGQLAELRAALAEFRKAVTP